MALITLRLKDGVVQKREVMANPYRREAKAKGIKVAEWLVSQKVDRVYIKESLHGRGPEYVFASAGVEMANSQSDTLEEELENEFGERSQQLTEEG